MLYIMLLFCSLNTKKATDIVALQVLEVVPPGIEHNTN